MGKEKKGNAIEQAIKPQKFNVVVDTEAGEVSFKGATNVSEKGGNLIVSEGKKTTIFSQYFFDSAEISEV